jgi:glutamate dehydrogenase
MPRDRFYYGALQRIQRFLKRTFVQYDPRSGYQVSSNEDQLVALYFLIPTGPGAELPEADIEGTISELSLSWEEKLLLLLSREYGRERGIELANLYNEIFSDAYKAATSHRDTLADIRFLEHLTKDKPLVLDLRPVDDDTWLLKIYKRGLQLSLSDLLPYLENVGFRVLNETVTLLDQHQERWGAIHTLSVKPRTTTPPNEQIAADVVLPGLVTLIGNQAENDRLNGLLLSPGLSIRQIALLRTIGHYLWQLKELSSESTLANALLGSPRLAALLVEAFTTRFSIENVSIDKRHARLGEIKAEFFKELAQVSDLIHDRTLRAMFNVVESTSRTNFFTSDNLRIALKIDCARISRMPEPRPFAEIFVCAPHFEGVHLRGGKVARGGIRWSERPDDFRTEVFGLMKTQMMKNAIIVPVGAKGGFIVKGQSKPSREDIVACYKDYIRSLLEITDNFVSGEVVPPKDVIRYDSDDPYLVVAADKGTAAFSNIANSIAVEEFGFWLGDAFASGGSRGYNHKDFGITARGAWEAAKRHFKEVGLDFVHNPFTVVGIGDMSGDVFGNGLLLSPQVKLIAAFDHRHIFLDPNPDPGKSYAERKRLFNLPSSSWMDYDQQLISVGGGVYERNRKEIPLSEAVRNRLGTDKEIVSGVELVQLILRAPVDLLWNGGIGTYVKASTEHNITVGDRNNDDVRVDARDLRTKIVVEGGNLGFTQRARIEFCANGGHINTDAVDNSGGVNLSDLEVNIKILMSLALAKKKITADERNRLLGEVADRVCESVLYRNARQAELISVAALRSRQNLTYYRGVIEHFSRKRLLDRNHDVMPDEDALIERAEKKQGLLRPELAILMACAKMQVTEVVLASRIPEDPALERLLFSYFPEALQQRFPEEIRTHPLRREIVAAQVANLMVERMGVTFLFRVVEELGASEEVIVTAFLAADQLIEAGSLVEKLSELDNHATARRYLAALRRVSAALDTMTRWILRGGVLGKKLGSVSEIISLYQNDLRSLEAKTLEAISSTELEHFRENMERFNCFPEKLVSRLLCLQFSGANLDLCQLAQATGLPSDLLLSLYSKIAELLKIRHLLELAAKVTVAEHWDLTAQKSIESLIRSIPGQIVHKLETAPGSTADDKLDYFRNRYQKGLDRFFGYVREAESKPLTVSALLVLSNQLNGFWRE